MNKITITSIGDDQYYEDINQRIGNISTFDYVAHYPTNYLQFNKYERNGVISDFKKNPRSVILIQDEEVYARARSIISPQHLQRIIPARFSHSQSNSSGLDLEEKIISVVPELILPEQNDTPAKKGIFDFLKF